MRSSVLLALGGDGCCWAAGLTWLANWLTKAVWRLGVTGDADVLEHRRKSRTLVGLKTGSHTPTQGRG